MKLTFRQIEPFVKAPDPAARVILVYGPDDGLMRERSNIIAKTQVQDLHDPFNVMRLTANSLAEDPARLSDEAHAISMMGGNRLIRIDDGSDKITTLLKDYLQNPSDQSLVLIQAGELTPRSSLRLLCEKDKAAAAVPCYVEDERDVVQFIRNFLNENDKTAEPDAVQWLCSAITGDRGRVRAEMEKLVLYCGPDQKQIRLEDAQKACGSAGATTLDALVYAVTGRQSEKAIRAFQTLLDEGTPVIAMLRALQNHIRRLHIAKARMSDGEAPDAIMKTLSPPIFFKQQDAFRSQMQSWSFTGLSRVTDKLLDLEARIKITGMPPETLCAQLILGMSAGGR